MSVTHHAGGMDAPDERGSWSAAYTARIDGMTLIGAGMTAEAAREDLRTNFDNFRRNKTLPRPGTQQRLEFASSTRIDAFGPLVDEFVQRVLHLEWALVTDESVLGHFDRDEDGSELKRRVMLIYGIDPDRLPDDRLVTILDAIAHGGAR